MKTPKSFYEAKDARKAKGQMLQVLRLLCNASKRDLKVPSKTVREIGGGATQRARDIRLGWRLDHQMLWLDPVEDHDGYYFVRFVTWEEWVKLHQERQAFELNRTAKIMADLTKKEAA